MDEQLATAVGPDRIDIAYERRGSRSDPPLLLVMGIAAQLVSWPEGFLRALVERGLQVICFDNRDAGRSTHLHGAPEPDLAAAFAGDLSSAAYTLSDMAADTIGLADALDLPGVHLVGASMGGAIAQTAAIEHPGRVRSLTSMMSTTGDVSVGQAAPETLAAVFGGPPATTRDEVVARALRVLSVIGSPGYPNDEADFAARAGRAFDRDFDEKAPTRQGIATIASGDRTDRLRSLALPALVVHGTADTLCDAGGGRATAAAIPGAELLLVDGMGHNIPPALWETIADAIAGVVRRGEDRAGAA